jgi:hypothetical protein
MQPDNNIFYNEVEKEIFELLEWMMQRLDADFARGLVNDATYEEMFESIEGDRQMVEVRGINRWEDEQQWKRTDLSDVEKEALEKRRIEGEDLDAKFIMLLDMLRKAKINGMGSSDTNDTPLDPDYTAEADINETRVNFEIYKQYLPNDFKASVDRYFEIRDFHYNVYMALEKECVPKLEALARKHYPPLAGSLHEVLRESIASTSAATCFGIAYKMKGLVKRMNEGIDVRSQYPKLEHWREFYLHPKPHTLEDKNRSPFLHKDDAAWEEEKKRQNREMLRYFMWCEQRKTEFYDIIQPPLFRLYPELEDLEGDFWVLYAVELRDAYEEWLSMMEQTETVVIYQMPPESINWKYEDYRKEVSARYLTYKDADKSREASIQMVRLPDEE